MPRNITKRPFLRSGRTLDPLFPVVCPTLTVLRIEPREMLCISQGLIHAGIVLQYGLIVSISGRVPGDWGVDRRYFYGENDHIEIRLSITAELCNEDKISLMDRQSWYQKTQ